jgi:uncharacterized membrane protein
MAKNAIVAIFDNRNQAYDAAQEIQAFHRSTVDITTGAIVEKDRLGNVTRLDTENVGGAWGTVAGLAGGALVGALVGLLAGPGGAAIGSAAGAAAAGSGAAAGGALGGALGASADFINTGLNEDYLDTVSRNLLPGKVALVAELYERSTAPVDVAVAGHGGVVYRSPLTS